MDPRVEQALANYASAVRAGRQAAAEEPRAQSARYDATTRRIVVELTNGCTFIFPADRGQGLAGASDAQLAEVEVLPGGEVLHWETLDADLGVPQLIAGIFGSRLWLRELGRRGGRATSARRSHPLTLRQHRTFVVAWRGRRRGLLRAIPQKPVSYTHL
ncbi:MAG: DUF2442 domain-containing protein, partial [Rhodocyclaceae bacterium]|nr:DUF2442 domain-containing protein [Rhodocyclaceae bacterium]